MPKWLSWPKKEKVSKPEEGIFYSGVRSDYSRRVGGTALTPEKIASIIRLADTGSTAGQFDLYSVAEEDAHVGSVLGKRRNQVVGKRLQIIPDDDTDLGGEAAELCTNVVFGGNGFAGIKNCGQALFDLTDAIGKAIAVEQIGWAFENNHFIVKELKFWPQRFLVLGNPLVPYDQDADVVRIQTDKDRIRGEDLQPWQWIVHVQKARSEPIARAALLRNVVWFYLFKHFSIRDWSIFIEKFGVPMRVGKYPRGSTDKERTEILNAAIQLGKDSACIMPAEGIIDLVEAKGGSWNLPHADMIKMCNAEISKAILGSTLTTEVGDTGGNRALGEVHERESEDAAHSDCSNLEETLRRDLLTPITLFNLGPNAPVPRCNFVFDEAENLLARAQREEILIKNMGLPVEKNYLYETYGIPAPTNEQDLLQLPAPQPAGGFGAMSSVVEDYAITMQSMRALADKKKDQILD